MAIKVTNGEIWQAAGAIYVLGNNKFLLKTSLKWARLAVEVKGVHKVLEAERQKLVEEYGEANEQGNLTVPAVVTDPETKGKVPNPRAKLFNTAIEEFFNRAVEIHAERCKLPETVQIEPNILVDLLPFIEE